MARAILALAIAGLLVGPSQPPPVPEHWRPFSGVWSATGRRHTLPAEGRRIASLVQLSGALTLTSGEGLTRGFSGKAIGFDDGQGTSVGRAVWTDAYGHQVFSVLKGESLGAGRRVTGTITGGTGRFAGATGDYTLTWQYVVDADEDTVQGRAIDLRGRIRIGEARP